MPTLLFEQECWGFFLIFVHRVFFSTSEQNKPWDKRAVVPQGQGCVQQRQWQVAVPAAPPRPPRFHLWAPPERTEITASTSVIGTVMRFTHAFGPAGSHRGGLFCTGSCHAGASLAPTLPLPTPWKASVSPGIPCTAVFGLLYVSFKGSPPLTVDPGFYFIAGLFFKARWTPADGKPGTKVAQVLLQTTVEMLNVPSRPASPGTGQTQEVLHPI